jgi:hypothetical protein
VCEFARRRPFDDQQEQEKRNGKQHRIPHLRWQHIQESADPVHDDTSPASLASARMTVIGAPRMPP